VRSPKAVEEELDEKVRQYPNPRNATIGRRIFTRQEAPRGTGRAAGMMWHGLEALYEQG
jgi:hypothetical protein